MNEFVQVTAQVFEVGKTVDVGWLEDACLWVVGDKAFDDVGLALEAAHTPIHEFSETIYLMGTSQTKQEKREEVTLQERVVSLSLTPFGESNGPYNGILDNELQGLSHSELFKHDAVELAAIALRQLERVNQNNSYPFTDYHFVSVYETGVDENYDWESGVTEYDPWWSLKGRLDPNALQIVDLVTN